MISARVFVGRLLAGTAAAAALLRLRVFAVSPVPSDDPVRWFALGTAADLGILGLAAGAAIAIWRPGRDRACRWAYAVLCLAFLAVSFAWSDALVYFGHAPRAADLAIAADPVFLRESADAGAAGRAAALLLIFAAAIAVAARGARRARFAWATPRRLLLLGLAGMAAALIPWKVHLAAEARGPLLDLRDLLRGGGAAPALATDKPGVSEADATAVRELSGPSPRLRFSSADYPLAHDAPQRSDGAPRLAAGLKPNVVIVLMEGVRANEVGAYNAAAAGLTPSIDQLARDGIRVERAYSPGTHTPEGELAVLYGLLATPGSQLVLDHADAPLTGLPELLRAAGWRSLLWIHGEDGLIFREDRFLRPRGFRIVGAQDFSPSDARTSWGFTDRALVRRAVTALDRLDEPFAAIIVTLSNHHPFALPPDARTAVDVPLPEDRRGFVRVPGWDVVMGYQTAAMMRTVHYTDEAVGEFFTLARPRPWYSRTVFVIASDHGLPVAPRTGRASRHEFSELRHRVPLIFYSPLLPGGSVVGGAPGSLADVPATIFGLLGIAAPRAGLGADLLDPAGAGPDRPVISWDDEARMVTVRTSGRVYHGVVPAGGLAGGEGLDDELLIDPAADPAGERDLKTAEPAQLERMRGAARIYLETYPRILAAGRSGVPPGSSR